MKHLEEMISHLFILLFVIRGSYSAVGSSPNSKLRKNYRNTIEIFEKLLNTPVSKEEHQEAIAAATANSASGRLLGEEKKFRSGDGMISQRIHESWTKKITKQVRFLQRKYNSEDCAKFGIPDQSDVIDVWGEIIDSEKLEDLYDQFKKLIWPNHQQHNMRVSQAKLDYPLTALYLYFGKYRLWIDENISACYNQDKIDGMAKARGASRVEKWTGRAHKKFNTMESRVCRHLYKGLVRTTVDDNPYDNNPGCDSNLFRQKHRDNINQQKKTAREEKRKNKKKKPAN